MTLKILLYIFILSAVFFCQPASAQLLMQDVSNNGIEEKIKSLFLDAPQMVVIAKCESGFRQFGSNGLPLRGGNGYYIGVFQISEVVHAQAALALGFDIYFTDGNIGYARYLYNKSGTVPWVSCLKNAGTLSVPIDPLSGSAATTTPIATSSPTPSPSSLTSNLQMGMLGPQVLILQKLLNAAGFTIATAGPGSPGNETMQFGKLTREAVMKFQCSKNIACDGNESTTGYGRLGPRTRALLLNF